MSWGEKNKHKHGGENKDKVSRFIRQEFLRKANFLTSGKDENNADERRDKVDDIFRVLCCCPKPPGNYG